MISDFTMIIVISMAVVCILIILACGVMCAVKCTRRGPENPPSIRVLENDHDSNSIRPVINADADNYKTLLHYNGSHGYPHQWNTTERFNQVPDVLNRDYGTDRKCTTLPWEKKMSQQPEENKYGVSENSQYGNGNEGPKYFVLDSNFINNKVSD